MKAAVSRMGRQGDSSALTADDGACDLDASGVLSRLRCPSVFLAWVVLVLASSLPSYAEDVTRVDTEIKTKKAWMGQQVRFYVTLLSPGPFSGTAVFQLPEIPNTVITKDGSPVVGSMTEGSLSWITQRHEFIVYTQQVGSVSVPAFSVNFDSKDSFVGEPVPREGTTAPVRFLSERPPGTEDLAFVVSSSTLEHEESWSMEGGATLAAGDVVTRSITRKASDTSAMFLAPFAPAAIDGVKVYLDDPVISEASDRGTTSIQRTDRIKYQFTQGGTFDISAIEDAWWDPKTKQVQSVGLEGRAFVVTAPPVPPEPTDWKRVGWICLCALIVSAASYRWLWPWAIGTYRCWHARYHAPLAVAARSLRSACRESRDSDAYTALVAWKHAAGLEGPFEPPLQEPMEALGRRLYRPGESKEPWNGDPLWTAFQQVQSTLRSRHRVAHLDEPLPPLNPGIAEGPATSRS